MAPSITALTTVPASRASTAMSTLYIFFIGGFMGGLVSGFMTDAIGVRGTVIFLGVPTHQNTKLRRNPVEDFTTVDSLTGPAFILD